MPSHIYNAFPGPVQQFILKACLLKGEEALRSWKDFKSQWDPEGILDGGSFRLLPLLCKNLLAHGCTDERMPMLKGIYKQAWCKNQQLFFDVQPLLAMLENAGIQPLLLKGIPLSILYYKDRGARPMSDADILVPFPRARQAIELLKEHQWTPENEAYLEYNLRYGKSMMFHNQAGVEFDLHWYPFFESAHPRYQDIFFENSREVNIGARTQRTLSAEDHLLHVLVHGLKYNPEPPIRWIPDAHHILLEARDEIDWKRFLRLCEQFKVSLSVRQALDYLAQTYHSPLPAEIRQSVHQHPVSLTERWIHNYTISHPDVLPEAFFPRIQSLWINYLRLSPHRSLLHHLWGFLGYLRFRTRGKNYVRIMTYYLRRSLQKVRSYAF
jgi:hypothetical protein